MADKIKVFSADRNVIEFIKEVNYQEADDLIKDTFARGGLVIDKKSLSVKTSMDPGVEEILIISFIGGGG